MRYRDIFGRINTTVRESLTTIKHNRVRKERRSRMAAWVILHGDLSSRAQRRMARLVKS